MKHTITLALGIAYHRHFVEAVRRALNLLGGCPVGRAMLPAAWRSRCCAAAWGRVSEPTRDTPPLGRVLPSTSDTCWYSFKEKGLRASGTGEYGSSTSQYP